MAWKCSEPVRLVWKSDAVISALNVISVGERFMFSNALRRKGNIFDRATGKVTFSILTDYACCRFTLSEPCLHRPRH